MEDILFEILKYSILIYPNKRLYKSNILKKYLKFLKIMDSFNPKLKFKYCFHLLKNSTYF